MCVFGIKLASEYNIKFLETSAKASINVEEAFITLSRDIKTKIDQKAVSHISSVCRLFDRVDIITPVTNVCPSMCTYVRVYIRTYIHPQEVFSILMKFGMWVEVDE